MLRVEKIKGTSTYVLMDDDKVLAKGDKKKMNRKLKQLQREEEK